ncbi:HAD-IB family phosphatase [Acidimicrobiaceae bacterium AH-315-P05]|nr:HAD-IB family phosphatase [Acidimicrobiaceae bacterium AH-315-P05]
MVKLVLVIADALAGKRIAITGSTGFLGTALVERLLRSVPEADLVLLVRPPRRGTVQRRVEREILKNDAFDRLREQLGPGFDDYCASRITVVAGDVGIDGLGLSDPDRAIFCSADTVIHSAATVSFDNPLDTSVEINLLGPNRILTVIQEANITPHFIAVSTCYVAGNRRGRAAEEFLVETPFHIEVDWRAEVDAARRARADYDAESRTPDMLKRFGKEAREELGAAGIPLLSAKTEQRRGAWVNKKMVDAGRSRATSLGWPDVYTYSKALGEQALLELHDEVPITVLRPSIIESAWSEPFPGWIRGFRMAEPLIISFGKGELNQFPGYPEGVVDVIPVDMVAAALCAAAANGPATKPEIFQMASGSVNPLLYKMLTETCFEWFTDNPIYDSKGNPIAVEEWTFTGATGLEEKLERLQKAMDVLEKTVNGLPIRGAKTGIAEKLQEQRRILDQAHGYVQIYGAYGRCEALYQVDRTLAMWDSLDPEDQAEFGFDPRAIDWHHYITKVHLPTVVVLARVKTTPSRRTGPSRTERLRTQVLDERRSFAAFDLENTLIASNVVESYAWLATRHLDLGDRVRFAARTLAEAPGLWTRDRHDRTDFLRHFYRRYKGAPVEQLDADALELLSELIVKKSFPAAMRRVRQHRAAGHRTVLITGALDLAVQPLRPLFDDIIAAEMSVRGGKYTGEMLSVPPTGEVRAQVMLDWANSHGLDPNEGVAYADSASDLPMLEAVGFPVAVNPESRLTTIADKRGWLTENWTKSPGGPRPLLPIGPKARQQRTLDRSSLLAGALR